MMKFQIIISIILTLTFSNVIARQGDDENYHKAYLDRVSISGPIKNCVYRLSLRPVRHPSFENAYMYSPAIYDSDSNLIGISHRRYNSFIRYFDRDILRFRDCPDEVLMIYNSLERSYRFK